MGFCLILRNCYVILILYLILQQIQGKYVLLVNLFLDAASRFSPGQRNGRFVAELPGAQVTTGDVYKEIVGLRADVVKALTRLEVVESRNRDADGLHHDHETRLRSLESAVPAGLETRIAALEKMAWKLVGAFAAVNAAAVLVEWLIAVKK